MPRAKLGFYYASTKSYSISFVYNNHCEVKTVQFCNLACVLALANAMERENCDFGSAEQQTSQAGRDPWSCQERECQAHVEWQPIIWFLFGQDLYQVCNKEVLLIQANHGKE